MKEFFEKMPHKMEKVMSEYKAGELKSGGDKTVKKRKQAIAIGLAMDYKAHGKKNPKNIPFNSRRNNIFFFKQS